MSQFGTMSDADVAAVKSRLIQQISDMSDAEIEIATKSEDSLAYYIANAFKAFAAALGYVVALPFAWAATVAKSLYDGFKKGWSAGFRSAGIDW